MGATSARGGPRGIAARICRSILRNSSSASARSNVMGRSKTHAARRARPPVLVFAKQRRSAILVLRAQAEKNRRCGRRRDAIGTRGSRHNRGRARAPRAHRREDSPFPLGYSLLVDVRPRPPLSRPQHPLHATRHVPRGGGAMPLAGSRSSPRRRRAPRSPPPPPPSSRSLSSTVSTSDTRTTKRPPRSSSPDASSSRPNSRSAPDASATSSTSPNARSTRGSAIPRTSSPRAFESTGRRRTSKHALPRRPFLRFRRARARRGKTRRFFAR